MAESDRTASLMSPRKLAQMAPRAATPAAWLNQMAADAGHLHVNRIREIGDLLQEQATSPELAMVASELERLAAALPALDFSLLQSRGWWARASGKSRISGAEFSDRFEKLHGMTRALASAANTLRQEQQADTPLAERALTELEVEYLAVEKIIEQGARWLHDMRTQLKLRQSAAAEPQAQQAVLEDTNRCDILVARLKLLRALCNAAAKVFQQGRAKAESHTSLTRTLQQTLTPDLKSWHGRLCVLASAASANKGLALELQGPMDSHQELQSTVKEALAACGKLLEQEQVLAQSLAVLSGQPAPPA